MKTNKQTQKQINKSLKNLRAIEKAEKRKEPFTDIPPELTINQMNEIIDKQNKR